MVKKEDNNIIERPPIIAVMGHVDHGKSTFLDYVRKTNIVEGESGGITQKLSAYEVLYTTKEKEKKSITFLDTPGHAAFSGMRACGADAADIVVLVVSAEDGVREQTKEALSVIKKAEIPYIVAITKIDKPDADIERAKNSLLENEVYLEGLGGNIPWVAVSSKTGEGIGELIEMILLVAEVEELMGDPSVLAEGIVIESCVDSKKGIIATLVIKNGTLEKGMFVVAGDCYSPVRAIETHTRTLTDKASLSMPIAITGFNKIPTAGEYFFTTTNKKEAEMLSAKYGKNNNCTTAVGRTTNTADGVVVIPLLVKTDTDGTLEAVLGEINNIKIDCISFKIIQSGSGDISENDLKIASSFEGTIIVGFNVKTGKRAEQIIDRTDVVVKTFDIIYKLTEWLTEEFKKRIPKEMKEETQGRADIVRIFSKDKGKHIIGGRVVDGLLLNKATFKVIRRENEIGEGRIIELQQRKIPTEKVTSGGEFGAMVESKINIVEGDIIELFISKD